MSHHTLLNTFVTSPKAQGSLNEIDCFRKYKDTTFWYEILIDVEEEPYI